MAAQPRPTTTPEVVPVNPDNFNRAETDLMFGSMVKEGALGKFVHHREPPPLDFPIIRPNRDTLYSTSVFDLDAGPVRITLPNAGKRFMSLQVVDERVEGTVLMIRRAAKLHPRRTFSDDLFFECLHQA